MKVAFFTNIHSFLLLCYRHHRQSMTALDNTAKVNPVYSIYGSVTVAIYAEVSDGVSVVVDDCSVSFCCRSVENAGAGLSAL
jgi:hypothetical protein